MEVKFADTFFESFKTFIRHETWWYKIYDAFRRGIPRFFKNLYRFRKILWKFQDWDRSFNLELFRTSLEFTEKYIRKHGIEVDESRLKKCDKMKRAIELLKNYEADNFLELAEKELGELKHIPFDFIECEDNKDYYELAKGTPEEEEHNSKIYARGREIEEEQWKELWGIIKGQDYKDFDKENDDWDSWFDGSGIKNFWD